MSVLGYQSVVEGSVCVCVCVCGSTSRWPAPTNLVSGGTSDHFTDGGSRSLALHRLGREC